MKKVILSIGLVLVSLLSYSQELQKPADPNGFENMTSEQIKTEVLSSKGIESGLYKEYVSYRAAVNEYKKSLPKDKPKFEFEGWKLESRTISNVGNKSHIYKTYSKRSAGKTIYVAVHYINGVEFSRTRHYANY